MHPATAVTFLKGERSVVLCVEDAGSVRGEDVVEVVVVVVKEEAVERLCGMSVMRSSCLCIDLKLLPSIEGGW